MPVTLTQLAWITILATLPLTFLPVLPGSALLILGVCIGLLMLRLPWRSGWFAGLWLLLFCWAAWHGQTMLARIDALTGRNISALVRITEHQQERDRLQVQLLRVDDRPQFPPLQAQLYNPPAAMADACAGQRWQMTLRLRPVHARLNEGGFDSQRQALAAGNPLQGRILQATPLTSTCGYRAQMMQYTATRLAGRPWSGLLMALAFGDRSGVSAATTQLLRETGIAHLMAISGLHIGLAAGAGWLLGRLLQLLLPTAWIGYRLPLFSGMMLACSYSWLAGGNPPALRAIVALSLWNLLRLAGWHCRSLQVWLLCLALLLLADPLSVLSDSLALSALAVGALLVWYQFAPLPGRFIGRRRWAWLRLLHLQLGILLLMLPLQAMLFHGTSLSALLANLWAVPLVSLVTVPLILLALLSAPFQTIAGTLWLLADRSLALVFWPLERVPTGWLVLSETQCWLLLLTWLILPVWRFALWRNSGATLIALVASLLFWRQGGQRPDWRIDMLDVGHGLAMVVSRHQQAILYDTGSRWPGGDMGKMVIIPWLQWHQLKLQQIVLSHGHLDHTGGLSSLQQQWPGVPVRSAQGIPGHLSCWRGDRWRWQGLDFSVLWPLPGDSGRDNDHSCVIRVSDGRWRVLLTGDLEATAERKLVAFQDGLLAADILQVGHHGSRTSSSPLWLRAVQGRAALASVARYSAWRLPSPVVRTRVINGGYQWWDTATSGQISLHFYPDRWTVSGLREQIMPRWYHQWFGAPRDSR